MESKTRTVARVFHDAQLTLIMNRTTWHYGQTPLNILVLGAMLGFLVAG